MQSAPRRLLNVSCLFCFETRWLLWKRSDYISAMKMAYGPNNNSMNEAFCFHKIRDQILTGEAFVNETQVFKTCVSLKILNHQKIENLYIIGKLIR